MESTIAVLLCTSSWRTVHAAGEGKITFFETKRRATWRPFNRDENQEGETLLRMFSVLHLFAPYGFEPVDSGDNNTLNFERQHYFSAVHKYGETAPNLKHRPRPGDVKRCNRDFWINLFHFIVACMVTNNKGNVSMTGLPDNIDEIVSEKDMKRNYEDLIKFVEHSIISCMGTNDPARAMAVGLVANGKEKGDYLLDNYRLLPKPNDLLKKSLRQIFKSREVVRWSAKSGLTFTWEAKLNRVLTRTQTPTSHCCSQCIGTSSVSSSTRSS